MPDESRPLLLVPTEMELGILKPHLESHLLGTNAIEIQLCGFGPIVAAARTAELLVQLRPSSVLLAGIAGSYDRLALGAAYTFERVGCYGIGVGSGSRFCTAQSLGWSQGRAGQSGEIIEDMIALSTPNCADGNCVQELILTVTSAAADSTDCAQRLECFPLATAEDMEAFGVAVACKLRGTPLTVVRGISNQAGDRNKKNWRVESALKSVAKLVRRLLAD